MTNRVLLNNVDHGDLRVVTGYGAAFGDNINQVLVFPTEFEAVQREYPIFFRKDADGAFQAVALLGLDRDENLFLDQRGWNARYVPAVQQRGPFSIALRERDGEPMIHVDLDHPRVRAGEGEPVFLPAGGNSPYLQQVARLLGLIYDGLEIGKATHSDRVLVSDRAGKVRGSFQVTDPAELKKMETLIEQLNIE
jgi:hypothetical protein